MCKDNPIEEMATAVCPLIEEYGSCEKCNSALDIDDEKCIYQTMAELFINADYRKASDVAEDIVRMLRAAGINEFRYPIVAEIKKKYMGKDTNVLTKTEGEE